MNEILNVNLGGYPFTIDNDAYHEINKYLSAIQRHFADSDGCDEILDDIEARMAELFTEFLQGKAIISMKELDAVIKVMGKPEDFGAESYEDEYEEPQGKQHKSFKDKARRIKTGKRFYRDPEEKVIGGVCGGIAAYFGIENPMWIRLGFLGLVFIGGVSILLYPILWIIVPEAKTAGDKLKMRGEPATVSNIARTIEDELNELSDKITEMSKDLGSKKKSFKASSFSPVKAVSKGISGVGKIVLGFVKLLKTIIKPFFSFFLGIMIIALGAMWIGWLFTAISSFPYLNYIGPSSFLMSSLGGLAIFNTVAIPIVGLVLLITRWFSSYRIPKNWRTNMRLAWVGSFLFAAVTIITSVMSYNHVAEMSERIEYSSNDEVLTISNLEIPQHKTIGFFESPFPGLEFTKKGLIVDNVYINFVKSDSEELIVETKVRSKGKSYSEAKNLAERLDTKHLYNDNELQLSKAFMIKKGKKFRGQKVEYIIHVPEGKSVKVDESLEHNVRHRSFFKHGHTPKRFEMYTWTMTDEGLVSDGWDKEYKAEKYIDVKSLENLNIDGNLATTIQYGKKTEILLKGTKTAVDKVKKIETDGTTSLIAEGYIGRNVVLEIKTPKLSSLQAKDLLSLTIEGFKQKEMELNFSGERSMKDVKIYVDVENLSCNIGGSSYINMVGSGKNLNVNILGGARITAEHFKAENVVVKGNIYSSSTFYASETFECPPHEKHSITIFGDAKFKEEQDVVEASKIVETTEEEDTSNPQ